MSVKYVKNIRISKRYGVSRPTVGKWLENAMEKKNNLQLADIDGKAYIIDNKHNHAELSRLKEKGVKYRNKIGFESVEPDEEFYATFTESQTIDLITNLEFKHQIPMKYAYLNGGADYWDKFIVDKVKEDVEYVDLVSNLYASNLEYITYRIQPFKKVNIFDIGPGNGLATKDFVELLTKKGFEVTYIAIDISRKVLDITVENMKSWFPNLNIQSFETDIETTLFQEMLFKSGLDENTCNLVLFVGGTIGNYYDRLSILKQLQSNLSDKDFFFTDNALDKVEHRTLFGSLQNKNYHNLFTWVHRLIGIREDMIEDVYLYNPDKKSRQFNIRLLKDVDIEFRIADQVKVVELKEGTEINIWHHHASDFETLFDELKSAELKLIHFSTNPTQDYFMLMSERNKA